MDRSGEVAGTVAAMPAGAGPDPAAVGAVRAPAAPAGAPEAPPGAAAGTSPGPLPVDWAVRMTVGGALDGPDG